MAKKILTDEEVDLEIEQLNKDPYVRLARLDQRIRYRRRQYLYQLRDLKKKGEALSKAGVTEESLRETERRMNDDAESN